MAEWKSRWNNFNSDKALVHVNYWKQIKTDNIIPPPFFVSIDPAVPCNFKCSFCNAANTRIGSQSLMSKEYMIDLSDFLKSWGVRAVCIAGLGESLVNPHTNDLFWQNYKNRIKQLLITNGSLIKNHPKIFFTDMVGVSVNAGNAAAFERTGMHNEQMFHKVIDNIKWLTYNRKDKYPEVTFKFLITPTNYDSLYEAVSLAKDIGCDLFQARPVGNPWFNLNGEIADFTDDMVTDTKNQIDKAREDFEDNHFKVYGVTHKFSPKFEICNKFNNCYATYVTCAFNPDGFVSLCCDRRLDERLVLCKLDRPVDILKYWGSEHHISLVKAIDVSECPRCTLATVNEIFENVIMEDKLNMDFI